MTTSKTIIQKQSGEVLNLGMDFSAQVSKNIVLSNPLVTVVPNDGTITVGGPTILGQDVLFTVGGGTHGQNYRFNVKVDTDQSETLIGDGILKVRDR